jgi:hypothetical protein
MGAGVGKGAQAAGGSGPGFARGGSVGGRGSGTSDSNLAWVSRGEHIMPASVVRQPGVLSFLEALRRGGSLPGYAGGGSVKGWTGDDWQFDPARPNRGWTGDDWRRGAMAMGRVINAVGDVAALIKQAIELLERALKIPGRAGGGIIGGRGTGTSDSNLAWLSRGEYVTPARAVSQPGVLAFLEALRRSGGNLRAVLDDMGHFALGGLVSAPAFAGGGMNNVTIAFPGLPDIVGLRASSSTIDELRQVAAMAQVRSGGRKPSRYS